MKFKDISKFLIPENVVDTINQTVNRGLHIIRQAEGNHPSSQEKENRGKGQ